MADVKAVAIIHGKVQGVFFRASAKEKAESLGLSGWVKNLPLMRVEAHFQGPREKVKEALAWCHKGEPPARVSRVEVRWYEPDPENISFEIRY